MGITLSRLLEYIDKDLQYDNIPDLVSDKVNYEYWKTIKRVKKILYRGIPTYGYSKEYIIKNSHVETGRRSYMNNDIRIVLNKEFKKKFGWAGRDGVMATGNNKNAAIFGEVYMFFPIDTLKFIWSPRYDDLNLVFEDDELFKIIENKQKLDDLINSYQDNDLEVAIKSGHEIMFNCKEYMLVNKKYERAILQ